MKIYNSLSKKVEEFVPITTPGVSMYTCGPTVYDYQHIGNFRTMVLSDVLHRILEFNGYSVNIVRNITDIDDKIIKNASEQKILIEDYTRKYTKIYFEDLKKLGILPVDVNPKATDYVSEMIEYIKILIKRGFAYIEEDGSVYFDISKFPGYGKLTGVGKRMLKSGTRNLSDEYTKDNIQDFALWKATKKGEIASYDSPWGRGRPGWHIECSVMSQKYLGNTFDIHVGGKDLAFPHHENEIAQSEAKTSKPFVRYWIHGEMLMVDRGKMSKSLRNFYLIKDVEEKGFEPLALRYLYLTAHYRDPLNFTWESLEASQKALKRLRAAAGRLAPGGGEKFLTDFIAAVNADLNMPKALAIVWEMVKKGVGGKVIPQMDKILGLDLLKQKTEKLPEKIKKLLLERETLRKQKKFSDADKIRIQIEKQGYVLRDKVGGSQATLK